MALLRTLTLIYAAVLTSALGASLAAILVYLRRIAGTLGEVGAALALVKQETEPLGEHLQRLQDATTAPAEGLADAQARLARADEALSSLTGQPQ